MKTQVKLIFNFNPNPNTGAISNMSSKPKKEIYGRPFSILPFYQIESLNSIILAAHLSIFHIFHLSIFLTQTLTNCSLHCNN